MFHSASAGIKQRKGMQKKLSGLKTPKLKNLNVVAKLKKHTKVGKTKKHKNFKGKVIDGVHELYALTIGMMLGVRCSVRISLMFYKYI